LIISIETKEFKEYNTHLHVYTIRDTCITLSISDFETTTAEKLCKCSLGTATSPLLQGA